jgi:molybdopterin molybdotransferase
MLPIHEALARVMEAFAPLGTEDVPLEGSLGRVLAAEITVRHPHPAFDASAMDGYAVRTVDIHARDVRTADIRTGDTHRATLQVRGEARAGVPYRGPVPPGGAIRIFTGAPVPEGADAVLLQEDVDRLDEEIRCAERPAVGQHIRRRGEDLAEGTVGLRAGTVIDAGAICLAASQGLDRLVVHRRPEVYVLSTGDELRPVGARTPPPFGTLFDSNGPMLGALVSATGAKVTRIDHSPDDLTVLTAAIRRGLANDLLITSGGVSVGDHDLVHTALASAGVERDFWKVALKPGKPLAFGRATRGLVFGLPGNPSSAFVTFAVFVRPGLRRMLGDRKPYPRLLHGRLESPIDRRSPTRTELRPARIVDGVVCIAPPRSSGSVIAMVGAEALAILPRGRATFGENDDVSYLLLADPVGSATPPFRDL